MAIFRPTVVIGLGGTGKSTILALKRMIAENSPGGLNDYPFLRLLEIDTDTDNPAYPSKIQSLEERDLTLDTGSEMCQLKGDWLGTPNLDDFPQIKEWFPSELRTSLVASDFQKGAGQKKPLGRFALAWNANNVYEKLKSKMDGIVSISGKDKLGVGQHELDDKLNVFICGSICGGTGSGTFLDVAHMVRKVSRDLNKPAFIHGMFALSSLFDGNQADSKIKPNCYASLMELDHFSNSLTYQNEFQRFRPAYKNFTLSYEDSAQDKPFDYPFLFDKTNQKGISLDNSTDLSEMIARFIYLLTGSEAAAAYESIDSNIKNNLDATYNNLLGKPILYRSMGTFSLVYPKRMVKQLLGYELCRRYFSIILDNSYNSAMVQALGEKFLNEYKLHPKTSLIERFGSFKSTGSSATSFADFLQSAWSDLAEGEDGLKTIDKKQYQSRIKDFFDQFEMHFGQYKDWNAGKAKELKQDFSKMLDKRVSELLSLEKMEDTANKTVIRGSSKRTEHFLEYLLLVLRETRERVKNDEASHKDAARHAKDEFSGHLDEIQKAAESILPQGGRLKKELEEASQAFINYFTAKQNEFIKGQIFQLVDGIRDRLGDEDGLISLLSARHAAFENINREFTEAEKSVKLILSENKNYKTGNLVVAQFDFQKDIVETFETMWKNQDSGEDLILKNLSAQVKAPEIFGDQYEKAESLGLSTIVKRVLKKAERFFDTTVDNVNIEDRILQDPAILTNFTGGNYWTNANLFIQLNGSQMSRVNIDPSKNEFFAITIPRAKYVGQPCKSMKGNLKALSGQRRCPVNTDASNSTTCPHHGKCIKQIILDRAPENIALIETQELGEINVLKSLAGYPLHASSTAQVCQPHYKQAHDLILNNAKAKGLDEEALHMFGPLQFPDLFEMTEDLSKKIMEFKGKVLLAYAVGKVTIEPLAIKFFTAEDDTYQAAKPSMHLADKLLDLVNRFQSNKTKDKTDIKRFLDELDLYIREYLDERNPERRPKLLAKLKKRFTEIKSSSLIPPGFNRDDADYLNNFALTNLKEALMETSAPTFVER